MTDKAIDETAEEIDARVFILCEKITKVTERLPGRCSVLNRQECA
jgi:hypothetical protein